MPQFTRVCINFFTILLSFYSCNKTEMYLPDNCVMPNYSYRYEKTSENTRNTTLGRP